jgi:hypothetical protein
MFIKMVLLWAKVAIFLLFSFVPKEKNGRRGRMAYALRFSSRKAPRYFYTSTERYSTGSASHFRSCGNALDQPSDNRFNRNRAKAGGLNRRFICVILATENNPHMLSKLHDRYLTVIEENTTASGRLKREMHLLGTVRLLLVAGLIALWVLFGGWDWAFLTAGSALFIVPFVWLMVRHNKLSGRKSYADALRVLCENEIKGLDYDFSAFDGAADKADAGHPFSPDLDIFGERSLFQSLNRTVIPQGREMLAEWFSAPLAEKSAIFARQRAVKELSEKLELRQHFHVTGILRRKGGEVTFAEPLRFTKSLFWRAMIWIVPAAWVVLIALYAAGWVNIAALSVAFIVSFAIANSKIKRINKIHNVTDKTSAALETYSRLMEITEGAGLSSELFKGIGERLLSGGFPASRAIKQLSNRLNALDQRANMVVAILNIFVLWDIRSIIRVAEWHDKHSRHVEKWLNALGEFDALCSLSGFAYNHPDYTYPEISEDYFSMSGHGLGHPLMRREGCVTNDIDIDRHPRFLIITGANMAGKSTYLRTVGVNFVLACVGAPVFASRLTVSPCNLVTSLRTSDSLADGESYFFAELKRLKMMIDRLRAGERLFIILDEILKGTNSADKQRGSLALVRQLVALKTCGIIATHDLALGGLRDELPEFVQNFRFEADIVGDSLSFTYKLREGVAENMNASYLMQKMGITV